MESLAEIGEGFIRWVVGYEGLYAVTSCGQVYSFYSGAPKRMKLCPDDRGYLRVNLSIDGNQTTKRVHRLVAEAFIEAFDPELEVDHINNSKTDNRSANLEMVPRAENMARAAQDGLMARGAERHNSKLDDDDVREMVTLLEEGELLLKEIAERFGVSQQCVQDIRAGKTWSWLTGGAIERTPHQERDRNSKGQFTTTDKQE